MRSVIVRWLESLQVRSREQKREYFMKYMKPSASDKVLAVGVEAMGLNPIANIIEDTYPFQENIVKVTADPPERWTEEAKKAGLVYGDGCDLPFEDDSFDICMSNAVIEHVGGREKQKKYVSELCRVAPRVFLTCPNYYFPFEIHARLPFVHFLPEKLRNFILKKTGRGWVTRIRLLSARELRSLFPKDVDVTIFGSRTTFMAESLVAIAVRKCRKVEEVLTETASET